MTGILSWTAEVRVFGVVVRIEHVLIQLQLGSMPSEYLIQTD